MNFKLFRVAIVCLFILFALVVSFQRVAHASAMPERNTITTCRALLPQCFPIGSPMWKELMTSEGRLPNLPIDEKDSSASKQICVGSGCPSFNERTSEELKETLDKKNLPTTQARTNSSTQDKT